MGRSHNTTPDLGDSLTIVHGKWTERVQEGTPGAVSRKLTKGKNEGSLVWELRWPTLDNLHLISGRFVQPEGFSDEQVELTCKDYDTGELFILSLPYDSKYLKTFIMCLPKLDTSRPFSLELHLGRGKTPSGDDKFNLRVVQEGVSLKTHHFQEWKKDEQGNNICLHHNGCPPPADNRDKRGGKLDFSEQNNFLCQYLEDYLGGHVAVEPEYASEPPPDAPPESEPAPDAVDPLDTEIPF